MSTKISNHDDIIDIRDVIARFEELEEERAELTEKEPKDWDATELDSLAAFLDDMKGYGGDEQWNGDWYPVTLIRDSHFEDYAQELAEELDLIPHDAKWPANCIDWEQAARELRIDYTSADFNGVTYWFR